MLGFIIFQSHNVCLNNLHNYSALWLDITSLQPYGYINITSALWLYRHHFSLMAVHHFSLVAEHHFSLFGWTASSWWGPFTKDVLSNLSLLNPLPLIQGGGVIQLVRYSMALSTWWYRRRKFSIAVSTWGTNCIFLCNFA